MSVAGPVPVGAPTLGSASGLISMLEEEQVALQTHALKCLNKVVDQQWAEVAGSISIIESMYEDEFFSQRELAALLACKVFYYLGELNDALNYALCAGSLFDVNENSDFVQTLLSKAIDEYIEQRCKPEAEQESIDDRLFTIVERMFERCFADGQFNQAIGIALESRRLDKLQEAITKSNDVAGSLEYATKCAQTLITIREFRQAVLRVLVEMYEAQSVEPNYLNMCQCLMFLDDADGVAKILDKLISGSEDEVLLAYQIAFSLYENEIQPFLNRVNLNLTPPSKPDAATEAPAGTGEAVEGMDTDGTEGAAKSAEESKDSPLVRLRTILNGTTPVNLHLEFLFSHNHADLLVLKNVRTAVEQRNSVCHSATVLCNALMHAGTTVDTFLRENLDWLSRATNWARFSATAGMGVIHRGQLDQGRQLMGPFLPREGSAGARPSPYTEGGALYALGLIHANHGEGILPFLLESSRSSNNEVIQHGASLGLGLAALGTANEEVFGDLLRILRTDSAVAGEGAGIGMGLLLAGAGGGPPGPGAGSAGAAGIGSKASQILAYCHKTAHEKIIRGCALGLALTGAGREEQGDALAEEMLRDADPILRYGGCIAVGAAHVATGNNSATKRLLHVAVSDVSDDVRRAAVMSLGLVLCAAPEQCPRVVSLLAESYNPHVRYGAAMAVGISCAGTGLKEAVALLEPMLSDSVDFVQQGALIAMAMVMIEQPEQSVAPLRKKLTAHISDTHESTMCKMGAIMAQGIIDAGGRNVAIGLRAKSGRPRMTAVVGMIVFTQYWYWYPLSYFLPLTFVPTAFIGLDATLRMPHCAVTSNCKPSTFAYLAPLTADSAKDKEVLKKAVLSTTAKAAARAKAKEAEKAREEAEKTGSGGGDRDMADASSKAAEGGDGKDGTEAMETETEAGADGEDKEGAAGSKPKTPEPTSEELSNPSRIVPAQEKYVRFDEESRFVPVIPVASAGAGGVGSVRGFVMLRDTTPGEEVEYVTITKAPAASGGSGAAGTAAATAQEEEPVPPEPFEYDPDE